MARHGSPLAFAAKADPPHRAVLTRLQWWLALGAIEFLAISLWLDTDRIAASGIWRLILKKLPDGSTGSFRRPGRVAGCRRDETRGHRRRDRRPSPWACTPVSRLPDGALSPPP
jgi:hypothetical protein